MNEKSFCGRLETMKSPVQQSSYKRKSPDRKTVKKGLDKWIMDKIKMGQEEVNNNSNYPNEELSMRQRSMKYEKLLDNIFAKIQVNTGEIYFNDNYNRNQDNNHHNSHNGNDKDRVLFNSYVNCSAEFYENPIRQLGSLKFVCLWPDGQLVDFSSRNHSMTLEVVERLDTLNHINPINGEVN